MATILNGVLRRIDVSSEVPGASRVSLRLAFADDAAMTIE